MERNSPVPPTKGPKQYFSLPRQWGAPFSIFGDLLQVNCNFSVIYAFLDFSLFGITSYKEKLDINNFVQNIPLFLVISILLCSQIAPSLSIFGNISERQCRPSDY